MTNDWMKDESLKNIEPIKLEFLQSLVFESSKLSKEQMMPFLLSIAKRGKERQISFSDDEMNAIVAVLRKYANSDEISKIEKIMALKKRKI